MGEIFFFQAEDGIRDLVRSRGLGDVYKRQPQNGGRPGGYPQPIRRHKALARPVAISATMRPVSV